MSMDKLMKRILETGDWKQCLFCQTSHPLREKITGYDYKGRSGEDREAIESTGYCTFCEKSGVAEADRKSKAKA